MILFNSLYIVIYILRKKDIYKNCFSKAALTINPTLRGTYKIETKIIPNQYVIEDYNSK